MTTFETFNALVGENFSAATTTGPVELRLIECRATGPDGHTDSFSLTFTSGTDTPIGQESYELSAAGFGPEPIFLVPVRITADRAEYEAVFHRLPN